MKLLRALPLSLLLFATPAAADVVPPEVSACQGRVAGAACGGELGVPAGVCRDDTCTRLDYLNWNRDASASPPTMQYPCVRCVSPADGGSGDAMRPWPEKYSGQEQNRRQAAHAEPLGMDTSGLQSVTQECGRPLQGKHDHSDERQRQSRGAPRLRANPRRPRAQPRRPLSESLSPPGADRWPS